jgi:hypothetical protein
MPKLNRRQEPWSKALRFAQRCSGIVVPHLPCSRFLEKLRRIYVRIKNQESSQTVLAGDVKSMGSVGRRLPIGKPGFPS